uniref:Uncharacterized protein n=1 Tax=Anguilla anguilla TaxID=7936 RepID=A0A0E9S7L7_ANGAN
MKLAATVKLGFFSFKCQMICALSFAQLSLKPMSMSAPLFIILAIEDIDM